MPKVVSTRIATVVLVALIAAAGVSLHWWGRQTAAPMLRVGIGPWIGYEPFVAARETGQWPETVRLIELESNTETIDAFIEERIDVAGLTLDESLLLSSKGSRHRIIAVLSDSRGGDAVMGRADHDSIASLSGQTVLVEDTAVGQLMLSAALEDAGLPMNAVKVRRVQATRLPIAWARGEAAGVVAYSPLIERLQQTGAKVLFSTRDHPGLVLDVLVLREGISVEDEAVHQLMAAWDAGRNRLVHLDDTLAMTLARGLGMTPDAYRAALANVALLSGTEGRAMLAGDPPAVLASIQRIERLRASGESGADALPGLPQGAVK